MFKINILGYRNKPGINKMNTNPILGQIMRRREIFLREVLAHAIMF